MPREADKFLFDALGALTAIEAYTAGLDFPAFGHNGMIQAAVERKFEIVGEALNRVQRVDADLFDRIPQARRIVGFRNILAHGYDVIDPEVVWDVIANHLLPLKDSLQQALARQVGFDGSDA